MLHTVTLFRGAPPNAPNGPAIKPLKPVGVYKPKFYFPSTTDTIQYRVKTAAETGSDANTKTETTQVQSLLGGQQIFGKINEVLDKAKSWVLVDMYNLQSPDLYPERTSPENTPGAEIQAGLVDRLIDLKKKNVNVRVILDNTRQQGKEGEKFEDAHNERTIQKLRQNGVELLTYPPEASIKSHVKILLADNKHAVIGGMNWGNHSAANHDGAVYLNGPDARNVFHKVFKPDWMTAGGDASKLPPITPFRQGKIKVLQTAGENSEQGAKNEILNEILTQIDQAQNSVHAELFVLTQKQVVDKLIAKHRELTRKGKEGVKLLVDPGLFFLFPNCRPGIQKLAKAGVPIRFFQSDRDREEKLHAKWAVFDRKNVLVGSANWSAIGLESKNAEDSAEILERMDTDGDTVRSTGKTNHEIALLVENAGEVGKTFAKQADHDFRSVSLPILEKGDDGKWHPVKPGPQRPSNLPDEAQEVNVRQLLEGFKIS